MNEINGEKQPARPTERPPTIQFFCNGKLPSIYHPRSKGNKETHNCYTDTLVRNKNTWFVYSAVLFLLLLVFFFGVSSTTASSSAAFFLLEVRFLFSFSFVAGGLAATGAGMGVFLTEEAPLTAFFPRGVALVLDGGGGGGVGDFASSSSSSSSSCVISICFPFGKNRQEAEVGLYPHYCAYSTGERCQLPTRSVHFHPWAPPIC